LILIGSYQRLKNGICYFSCFNAQHLRVAPRIKKQLVVYTSAKIKFSPAGAIRPQQL